MNSPRTFEDAPAERTNIPLLVGIMSPSGGGKTRSALRLATGMRRVLGGDIYGIDTESGRMKAYAPLPGQKADPFHKTDPTYDFRHVPFAPPFGSLDYLAAVQHCVAKGAKIVIIDSMTHEHVGEGGYLETAEKIVDRIAGNDWKKREAVKMLGWATAGPLRQKMIEGFKQLTGVAFICCFRAREKTKPVKGWVTDANGNKREKTEIVDMGLMPVAGEEWVYEMLVNCMLPARSGGVPQWRSDAVGERMMMKQPSQFAGIFEREQPLSEDIGEKLAIWAKGGVIQNISTAAVPEPQVHIVKDVTEEEKTKAGQKVLVFTVHTASGATFVTRDEKLADAAKNAHELEVPVAIGSKLTAGMNVLESITPVDEPAEKASE